MKKVLTIDFNIIMSPSLNLYDKFVSEFNPLANNIDDKSLLWYGKAELVFYRKLSELLTYKLTTMPAENIHFLHGQEDIIRYLDKDSEVINIDFYHDLEKYDKKLTNDNWAAYAIDKGLISKYTWIHAMNSNVENSYNIDTSLCLEKIMLTMLPDVDEIIISSSEEWVLPQYMPLFDLWLQLPPLIANKRLVMEDYPTERDI